MVILQFIVIIGTMIGGLMVLCGTYSLFMFLSELPSGLSAHKAALNPEFRLNRKQITLALAFYLSLTVAGMAIFVVLLEYIRNGG